ncbi:protein-glutamate O-methyltransferase CheR [Geomonas sp. Red32]|uniref:CheR family methyltransferase n=1 Tax=Geomonas sp. Red32 TaxID=2912856 RepID=UPI00202CB9E5|nr:protein-glutamate O-methyltransferase CheR [Geomonas sp. Red32]MCM0081309.1 protein-glutamate O-methyltransferase CheR [Geomonas sp. Red32]
MLSELLASREPEIPPETFEIIGRILKARTGFSLDGYKDQCVKRRINIRVRATESPSVEAYSALLTEDPAEQERLLRTLTIHVSHFFRNPSTFDKLAAETLPELLARRSPEPVRILSVGCAAGEEPYGMAILLAERFADQLGRGLFQLRGCDVDQNVLAAARAGLFHPDRLNQVSAERLTRWFTGQGAQYELCGEIRSLVTFYQADLNDEVACPESDLILCRNVLIYFERGRQEAILNRFADALGPGGMLVLGKSETIFGSVRRRFRTVCPVERIYRVL